MRNALEKACYNINPEDVNEYYGSFSYQVYKVFLCSSQRSSVILLFVPQWFHRLLFLLWSPPSTQSLLYPLQPRHHCHHRLSIPSRAVAAQHSSVQPRAAQCNPVQHSLAQWPWYSQPSTARTAQSILSYHASSKYLCFCTSQFFFSFTK